MEHTQFFDGGWCWMTHPSRNDGNPIPVKMVFEKGTRWYLPCDPDDVTEFEWDLMDDKWKMVFGPMASPEQEIAALKAQRDELLAGLERISQSECNNLTRLERAGIEALIAKHKGGAARATEGGV